MKTVDDAKNTSIKNILTCLACYFVCLFDFESGSHLSRHRQPVGRCDERWNMLCFMHVHFLVPTYFFIHMFSRPFFFFYFSTFSSVHSGHKKSCTFFWPHSSRDLFRIKGEKIVIEWKKWKMCSMGDQVQCISSWWLLWQGFSWDLRTVIFHSLTVMWPNSNHNKHIPGKGNEGETDEKYLVAQQTASGRMKKLSNHKIMTWKSMRQKQWMKIKLKKSETLKFKLVKCDSRPTLSDDPTNRWQTMAWCSV